MYHLFLLFIVVIEECQGKQNFPVTRVRNILLKFICLLAFIRNTGKSCWGHCNKKQGACSWCGSEGMCCTQKPGWNDISKGCDGTFGGLTMHECVRKPSKISIKVFSLIVFLTKKSFPFLVSSKCILSFRT